MEPNTLPHALVVLDYFGIGVFAISGALVAAERKLDFVTFVFFAVVTGVGGGTLRDLLIGAPVFWVHNNGILLICLIAAVAAWVVHGNWTTRALLWFDAALTQPTARPRRLDMACRPCPPFSWEC